MQFVQQKDAPVLMRNTVMDYQTYNELIREGGRPTVPCLKIAREDGSTKWMYESKNIIKYLEERP